VAVIEVSGIGFEVHMTDAAIRELSGTDTPVRIHTHLAVRDGEPVLYGFLSRSEVEMFLMLISVNRVDLSLPCISSPRSASLNWPVRSLPGMRQC